MEKTILRPSTRVLLPCAWLHVLCTYVRTHVCERVYPKDLCTGVLCQWRALRPCMDAWAFGRAYAIVCTECSYGARVTAFSSKGVRYSCV